MIELTEIRFELKLKRTRTPSELFEKLKKSFKKSGPTKKWSYYIVEEESAMMIDFGDNESETLRLIFDDKKCCNCFCKVAFPSYGEEFENEKTSEYKALVKMFYSARAFFSQMTIEDGGIAEGIIDTIVNKISLRELTDDEKERANRLFSEGHTDIREFITALLYDYRELPYSEDFIPYINKHIGINEIMFWDGKSDLEDFFDSFINSFLCEVTEYNNKGRLYKNDSFYGELNGTTHAAHAFRYGIEVITGYITNPRNGFDPKSVQVMRMYRNKYLPLLEAEDSEYERCLLAYRFFVSTLDFLTFKIVGKDKISEDLIDDYLVRGIRASLYDHNSEALREAVGTYFRQNFKPGPPIIERIKKPS